MLRYTNINAAQLQHQSRSSCIVAQPCLVDIFVTNLMSQVLVAFQISSSREPHLRQNISDCQATLMGPGMNVMSVIKTSLFSFISNTSSFTVSAGSQQISFRVSFSEANKLFCFNLHPSIVPTYGGNSITISVQNIFNISSSSTCRICFSKIPAADCLFEKLSVKCSYSFSAMVPLLSGNAATYTLELQIIPNYVNVLCG